MQSPERVAGSRGGRPGGERATDKQTGRMQWLEASSPRTPGADSWKYAFDEVCTPFTLGMLLLFRSCSCDEVCTLVTLSMLRLFRFCSRAASTAATLRLCKPH